MATKSYWYVREQEGLRLFHLVDADGASAAWQKQLTVGALCGVVIRREGDKYVAQYEGDMIGWPTCSACFKRAG